MGDDDDASAAAGSSGEPEVAARPSPTEVYRRAVQVARRFSGSFSDAELDEIAQDATVKWWRMPAAKQAGVKNWRKYVATITANLARSRYRRATRMTAILGELGATRSHSGEPDDSGEELRHRASDGAVYMEGEDDALASLAFEDWLEAHGAVLAGLPAKDRAVLAFRARVLLGELSQEEAAAQVSAFLDRAKPWSADNLQVEASRAAARLIERLAEIDPGWRRVWWQDAMQLHGKRIVGYLQRTATKEADRKGGPRRVPTKRELGAAAAWFLQVAGELGGDDVLRLAAGVAGAPMSPRGLVEARDELFEALDAASVGPHLDDRVVAAYVLEKWSAARDALARLKSPPPPAVPPAAASEGAAPAPRSAGGLRLLVADDLESE